MRTAILDLGTNTFNLLVAEKDGAGEFTILHESKLAVKLGKGGISKNYIVCEAIGRASAALAKHKETINKFGVKEVFTFGTSAIRSAENGNEFKKYINEKYGFDINIIDGNREAELIYKGIKASGCLTEEKRIILDIGGGSNEFIIGDKDSIFWKESFPIGIARIISKFELSNPIKEEEIKELDQYFEEELAHLFKATDKEKIDVLIGAAGSFETLSMLIQERYPESIVSLKIGKYREIKLDKYEEIHTRLLKSTLEERLSMAGLEISRAEMIVPASVFIHFIINRLKIKRIIQSDYSLKEGFMYELVDIKEI